MYKVGDLVKIENAEWQQTENGISKCDIVGEIISIKGEHSHPNVHDYLVRGKQGDHYINHGDKRLSLVSTPELKEAAEINALDLMQELAGVTFDNPDERITVATAHMMLQIAIKRQSSKDNKRIVESQSASTETVEQAATDIQPYELKNNFVKAHNLNGPDVGLARTAIEVGIRYQMRQQKHQSNQEVIDIIKGSEIVSVPPQGVIYASGWNAAIKYILTQIKDKQ